MSLNTSTVSNFIKSSDVEFKVSSNIFAPLVLPFSSRLMRRILPLYSTYIDYLRPTISFIFILAIPFIFNYVATWLFFKIRLLSKKVKRIPPTIPHFIPFIGSSLELGLSPLKFVNSSTYVQATLLISSLKLV